MDVASVNLLIAFWAGILSFVSPCVLPLYPSYLSYITGISVDKLKNDINKKEIRNRAMAHTFFFVIGFSIVFIAFGMGASFLGDLLYHYKNEVRQIGAILIILMGLFTSGFIKWNWLLKERRMEIKNRPAGYFGSSIIGMSFAAGWTPCVGPILSSILLLAESDPSKSVFLLMSYSLGFALPFFIMAFFISSTRWILRYSDKIMKIGGILLITIGIMLFTNKLNLLSAYFTKWFGVSWF